MKTEESNERGSIVPNEGKTSVWQDKTVRWVAIVGGIVALAALGVLAIFLLNKRGPRPIADDDEGEPKVVLTEEFREAVSKYDMLGEFGEGMAAVHKNGKWGYIDRRGKEVIPCQFEGSVGVFSEGLACVRNEKRYDFINRDGEVKFSVEKPGFIPAICEDEGCFYSTRESQPYFVDGECTLYFMNSSNYDFVQVTINKKGEIINERKVDYPSPKEVDSPYTAFNDSTSGMWGLKDADGDIVIPAKYSFVFSNVSDGVALVTLEVNEGFAEIGDTHFGYADLNGNDTFSPELKQLARKWDKLNGIYQGFVMALHDAQMKNTDDDWFSTQYFRFIR